MRSSVIFAVAAFLMLSCSTRDQKTQQYFVEGEQLYNKHCANCHQRDGKGLALIYPPLDKSDYFDQYPDNVVCIIRNGKSGEMIVNGKSFNQPMPGVPTLTNLEIAEIMTYIGNKWGRNQGIFTLEQVERGMRSCQ